MTVAEELLTVERQLWRNDPHIYAATYLPDAVLIFPQIGRISLDTAVDAIRRAAHQRTEGRGQPA